MKKNEIESITDGISEIFSKFFSEENKMKMALAVAEHRTEKERLTVEAKVLKIKESRESLQVEIKNNIWL